MDCTSGVFFPIIIEMIFRKTKKLYKRDPHCREIYLELSPAKQFQQKTGLMPDGHAARKILDFKSHVFPQAGSEAVPVSGLRSPVWGQGLFSIPAPGSLKAAQF